MRSAMRWWMGAMAVMVACGSVAAARGEVIWQSRPVVVVPEVKKVAPVKAWGDFDAEAWAGAGEVGWLSSKGVTEKESVRTRVKLAREGDVLWIFVRASEEAADWHARSGDGVEVLFAGKEAWGGPMLHVKIKAEGGFEVAREPVGAALSGPLASEAVNEGVLNGGAGVTKGGWFGCVGLDMKMLGLKEGLRLNVMRTQEGKADNFAWGDLWGGRLRNTARLGRVQFGDKVDSPTLAWMVENKGEAPLLQNLKVGNNEIRFDGWGRGNILQVNGKEVAVKDGMAIVEVTEPGVVELSICDAKGQELRGYTCDLGRPAVEVKAEEVADKFREGIEELEGRALVRAAVCDAANVWRTKQRPDGAFGVFRGDTLWPQAMTCVEAVVYKTKWAENPYCGDKRFLESAVRGMDCALDPSRRERWRNDPDNRSLQAFLMTYELLRDDVPVETARRWRGSLEECVEAVVRTWVGPISLRMSRYSDDIGTSTNHWSLHAANVYTGGRLFGRRDWLELGQQEMRKLAAHERAGIFSERRHVPTPSYNWLTATALAEYFLQSGDREVSDSLTRCEEFAWKMSVRGGDQLMLFDGRVNGHTAADGFPMMYAFTPEGRGMARDYLLRIMKERGPGRISAEGWHRWSEMALAWPEDGERKPGEYEFSFMDGLAAVQRKQGFCYGVSGLSDRPMNGLFRLDAQNFVELWHEKAGKILLGDNSQAQPEAGSFFRKVGDKTEWLPVKGQVTRVGDGHFVRLKFDDFEAGITVRVKSETQAQITVQVLEAKGDAPVVFNFFPAGAAQLGADGRTIQAGVVKIAASHAVKLETGMKMYNPYTDKYGVVAKPNRAWVELPRGESFVLQVDVESK